MFKTGDLYKYNRAGSTKMLSGYTSQDPDNDFWADYRTNYSRYDAVFNRMFNSFWYFMQSEDQTLAEVASEFTDAVYDHLLMNDKKYTELFRIQVIPDEDYSLTNNYDVTEHMEKEGSENNDNTYGARTDTGSFTEGSQSTGTTNNYGEQTNTTTDKVAPYDSSTFNNDKQSVLVNGVKIDSIDVLMGSRLDVSSNVKGQQVDDLNKLYGEEYTLTRKGNIGVQTATDMIDKHKKFWSLWEFYEYIFKEISKDLLLL